MQKIKLIWDFRGVMAEKTAEHHAIHLKEYIQTEKLPFIEHVGFFVENDTYATAFMVVLKENMIQIRDILKPHRAVLFE